MGRTGLQLPWATKPVMVLRLRKPNSAKIPNKGEDLAFPTVLQHWTGPVLHSLVTCSGDCGGEEESGLREHVGMKTRRLACRWEGFGKGSLN